MTDAIRHRGPDDHGRWADTESGVVLGHRRLSILDLSAEGHQPMHSADGSLTIVFNGEIYNFGELRERLVQRGHTFRGHSDTEVMLAAFLEWGVEAATKLFNGMFSFAVWDKRHKTLHLGRDRMGKKPLYYGWSGGCFLFGSELKSLRAHPAFHGAIDRNALALFLRHGYIAAPWSIYEGIYKLPPGCLVTVRPSDNGRKPQPQPYWSAAGAVRDGLANPLRSRPEEIVEELKHLLEDAVRLRMVADVPLGAFLSGGIDSSLTVALMQSLSSRPVKTFAIGFHDRAFDEAVFAKDVARHLGTDHTELYVTSEDALGVIPRLPHMFDEPFADASQVPTFLVSELARRHVTVSLSGDGGDELFGGYQAYFSNSGGWGKYARMPRAARSLAGAAIRGISQDAWTRVLSMLPRESGPDAGERMHRLGANLQQNSEEIVYRNLVSHWSDPSAVAMSTGEHLTPFSDPSCWIETPTFFERMMYVDSVAYLPDDILVKVDRASMAVSLESRCPLLDYRVFEYAWRIPLDVKVREGKGKWPLREVLYGYVPREMIERPKRGFAAPIASWLRGPLREWAEDLIAPDRLKNEGVLSAAPIRRKWADHVSGAADYSVELWDVLMFQAWYASARTGDHAQPSLQAV